jgi:hypothetical protein
MHEHSSGEHSDAALRPKGARLDDERPEGSLFEAAAGQRTDVLGASGLLHMQRAIGNAGTAALAEEASPVLDVVGRGGGTPLDEATRSDMESRLGADFSDVRVHTDSAASDSARAVGAHAYTVGSDVVFQEGRFDPTSTEGRTTLAHELTHVVQQRNGPVDGTPTGDGVSVSDPGDRFERAAAENAERAMSRPPAATAQRSADVGVGSVAVQRADEDEDDLQRLADPHVQREDEDEDELQRLADPHLQREADDEEELES